MTRAVKDESTVDFDRTAGSWRSSLAVAWRAFWISRLFVVAFVYLGHSLRTPNLPINGGWQGVANTWLNPWTTFDSAYFLRIAESGYNALELTAFFPLYPSLLGLAGTNILARVIFGIALSNFCLFGGLALAHRLIVALAQQRSEDIFSDEAKNAVWLLAFWPATPYFSAVYSDALFFCLASGAFWCAQQKQWLRVGILALFASLARNAAPVLFLALIVEYARTHQKGGCDKTSWRTRDVLCLILSPLSFVALQICFRLRFGGDVLLRAQRMFGRSFSAPWTPVAQDFADFVTIKHIGPSSFFNLVAALLAPVFAGVLWKRTRSGAVFLGGLTLMALLYGRSYAPHTFGIARYVAAAWPFALGLALFYDMTARRPLLRALFQVLYLLLCAASCCMFGLKESLF
ncbi:MAG TPA: mannosyltransferase family protein [Abditibacteriaceae bacterium]